MTLKEIQKRLSEISAEVETLDAEKDGDKIDALDGESKGLVEQRNKLATEEIKNRAMPDNAFKPVITRTEEIKEEMHWSDKLEYRQAFKRFIQTGDAAVLSMQHRAGEVTTAATEAAAAIPLTVVNEIIRQMKVYGDIWARVRRTNLQGGVQYPISTIRPVATWVGEGASESKKLATDKVMFMYYGLECKLAQTLVASVVTLDAFQALFVELAVEAIVEALEIAIVNGTGSGQPLGITKDTRIPSGNSITVAAADLTWNGWQSKVFAKMKKAYRNGTFLMAQGTFDGKINGLMTTDGQIVGRANYGIDGAETYRFGGKEVLTVEENILPTFDDATAGDIFAVFVKLSDYAVNSNMEMVTVKWTDHDTNEVKNKAIIIADGKLLDPHGVLLIKKG